MLKIGHCVGAPVPKMKTIFRYRQCPLPVAATTVDQCTLHVKSIACFHRVPVSLKYSSNVVDDRVCLTTGLFVYGITTLSSYDDGTVADDTRRLSVEEFNKIEQERADAARPKVLQRRVAFLWERQAFELQSDLKPAYGISVLHRHSEVRFPRPDCSFRFLGCMDLLSF